MKSCATPEMTPDGIIAVAATAHETWRSIALSTEAADRAEAEATVLRFYTESIPEIIWCRSPLEAAQLIVANRDRLGAPLRDRIRDQAWSRARTALVERLGPAEFSRVWQATCGAFAPFLSTLISNITSAAEQQVPAEERPALCVALTQAVHGPFDATWLPLYEAAGTPETEPLAHMARLARTAGWWWPFENAVILTERPLVIRLDAQNRLHHGEGPALAYADGFALHAWRGTALTPEFARELAATTPDSIRAQQNTELRRMMMEHYTPERFLKDSGAQPVHQDETGKLWRIEMPEDEHIVMVEVVNSSPEPDGSYNIYFLRVPPTTRTAKEGVAWTFGLTEEEYQPLRQT